MSCKAVRNIRSKVFDMAVSLATSATVFQNHLIDNRQEEL